MPKKIEGIFFDFGGTLFDYYPSNAVIWSRIAKRLGVDVSPEDPRIKEGMRQQHAEYIRVGKPFFQISRAELHALNCRVLNAVGINGAGTRAVIDDEFRKREQGNWFRIYPDSKATLEKIKSLDIKIGLLSNCPEHIVKPRRGILRDHGILAFFDSIILSAEVGFVKPQKEIFELALKELGVLQASKVMHVGDSFLDDVIGAKNAGLVPVFFDPLDLLSVDNVIKIRKLSGLLQYIR